MGKMMSSPPEDMPDFGGLGHDRHRALEVWYFLRTNHGRWFTVGQIAVSLGLHETTVQHALYRIFGLLPIFRPRIERRMRDGEYEYRFARIIGIAFEENSGGETTT